MKTYTHKEIGYSYPTSPNAERFGFTKKGCWTIGLWYQKAHGAFVEYVSGFETKDDAFHAANSIDLPFHKYSI